jgi:hypothetical protein
MISTALVELLAAVVTAEREVTMRGAFAPFGKAAEPHPMDAIYPASPASAQNRHGCATEPG